MVSALVVDNQRNIIAEKKTIEGGEQDLPALWTKSQHSPPQGTREGVSGQVYTSTAEHKFLF